LQQFLNWVQPHRPGAVFMQFFVDHPFALSTPLIDQFVTFPNYRLLLPCIDDRSLLQVRWPSLHAVTCNHAVDPSSLCPEATIGQRESSIVIAGTIVSPADLNTLQRNLPEQLRQPCTLAADLVSTHPHVSPLQALELFMPPGLRVTNQWHLLQLCTRYMIAAANRSRRLNLTRSLQGLPVRVYGNEPWRDECTGTIEYRGALEYAMLPRVLASSRIAVAWNPTQFTHSLSERVLLCMAAGCATITDDRPLVRHQFTQEMIEQYRADAPETLRARVETLLGDPDRCDAMGRAGRAEVQRGHLWDHRTDLIRKVLQSVLSMVQEKPAHPA
jgi:hypothetical protein